ncbi:uncharacterized protein LOC111518999 [Drosophila willistoni]|uniref:uncharacterized protein LOC111518999 n=1 Tax=Drosophila willistoni TaxID=7260 RepID=UPI000C26CF0D|nr:uncharacterized protein LOC111518999 [Drosophila willistoni]
MKLCIALVLISCFTARTLSEATAPTIEKNENDPTCTTYNYFYAVNGVFQSIVIKCSTSKPYFDSVQAKCVAQRPEECYVEEETASSGTENLTKESLSTTTVASWSAEATCLTATSNAFFKNEDDVTCNTYIYCYQLNDVFKPIVMKCTSHKPYFDSVTKRCVSTQPSECIE